MNPLPVIQPPSEARPVTQAQSTSAMISDAQKTAELTPPIVQALSTVVDPEIPVNIYELGLIYEVIVDASANVGIRMTLTAPACPAAQILPSQVRDRVSAVEGVRDVIVDIVWDPPWDRDRMSEAARLQLGL